MQQALAGGLWVGVPVFGQGERRSSAGTIRTPYLTASPALFEIAVAYCAEAVRVTLL